MLSAFEKNENIIMYNTEKGSRNLDSVLSYVNKIKDTILGLARLLEFYREEIIQHQCFHYEITS